MTYLLSLDPGYRQSGIALFYEDMLLYGALIEVDPLVNLAAHWREVAEQIDKTASRVGHWRYSVTTEIMQIDGRTGKAQAGQLLRLSGLAGAVVGEAVDDVSSYTPSEWNKNRSKGPNHSKILRALEDEEKTDLLVESEKITNGDRKGLFESLKPKIQTANQLYERAVDERTGQAEHVLDAVGIGLYHLGRLR